MKQGWYEVLDNRPIASLVYEMRLKGDSSAMLRPGQFVNVKVGNAYLRRPLSVAAWDEAGMTLIYKVVGDGTAWMADCKAGDRLDLLTGLGNGFDLAPSGQHPLLIGGGVGLPPLYQLGLELIRQGKQPRLVMGFGAAGEVFYQEEFERLMSVSLCTVDGSAGEKGLVTDVPLQKADSYLYACGPVPMLKALSALPLPGQLSLEERMACGFGACMGCSIQTSNGAKRVCKEGPVFLKEELQW